MSRRPHIASDELAAYGDALLALRRLRADFVARIEAEERVLVGVMRRKGATWEEVGEVFGISRPAARKRFLGGAPHDEGGPSAMFGGWRVMCREVVERRVRRNWSIAYPS